MRHLKHVKTSRPPPAKCPFSPDHCTREITSLRNCTRLAFGKKTSLANLTPHFHKRYYLPSFSINKDIFKALSHGVCPLPPQLLESVNLYGNLRTNTASELLFPVVLLISLLLFTHVITASEHFLVSIALSLLWDRKLRHREVEAMSVMKTHNTFLTKCIRQLSSLLHHHWPELPWRWLPMNVQS